MITEPTQPNTIREHTTKNTPNTLTEMGSETSSNSHHIDITAIVIGSVVVVVLFILAVVFTVLAVSCLVVKYRR